MQVPWATPYAELVGHAEHAVGVAGPGDDALWPLDGLSWPPPLQGSLAHLGWGNDPANPAAQ